MEKLIKYFQHIVRQYESPLRVIRSGYMDRKNYNIESVFKTISFSFITRGEGSLYMQDKTYAIKAPVVFMQYPGMKMCYGPSKDQTWDEVFFTYSSDAITYLKRRNFIKENQIFRPINNLQTCLMMLRDVKEMLKSQQIFCLERFDSLAENLLLESLLPDQQTVEKQSERIVNEICADLKKNNYDYIDINHYAAKYNISAPTLRRYWKDCTGIPPGQYITEKIIQEACFYLSETDDPIKEIAECLHFKDQLYFSKKFKKITGYSPSAYRNLHTMRLV